MSDDTIFGERSRVHLQSNVSSDGMRVLLWGDQGMQAFEIDFHARPLVHMRPLETDARGTCWAPVPNDVWPLTRGPALPARALRSVPACRLLVVFRDVSAARAGRSFSAAAVPGRSRRPGHDAAIVRNPRGP